MQEVDILGEDLTNNIEKYKAPITPKEKYTSAALTRLCNACQRGDLEELRSILNNEDDYLNIDGRIDGEMSALHIACLNGHVDCVHELLKAGADINITPIFGPPPIAMACYAGHLNVVQALLSYEELDVNHSESFGITATNPALWIASARGHLPIVEALLDDKRADINKKGTWGTTALHAAISFNQSEIVKALVKHPKINVNLTNVNYESPLILAIKDVNEEAVLQLLSHPQINLNATYFGVSPLLFAVSTEKTSPDIVERLIQKGCDVNNKHTGGITPLHAASAEGDIDAVRVLLKAGADTSLKLLSQGVERKHFGKTAEQLAVMNGHTEVASLIKEAEILAKKEDHRLTIKNTAWFREVKSAAENGLTSVKENKTGGKLNQTYQDALEGLVNRLKEDPQENDKDVEQYLERILKEWLEFPIYQSTFFGFGKGTEITTEHFFGKDPAAKQLLEDLKETFRNAPDTPQDQERSVIGIDSDHP